ncbi:MAG: hypothetical protein SGJ18_00490 [Pseudomonadota bacterium]|nr:hypothetical protein [Pseudomonadota bacterium]
MKKLLGLSLLVVCLAGALACSKKKNIVNSAVGNGFINNCPIGSVITPQGTILPQGNCPYGQGQSGNTCVAGTACTGGFPITGGTSTAYMNTLSVTHKSVFENLMAEIFGVCQKWGQYGSGDCATHSNNAEIYLEQIGFGQSNQVTQNNTVWVTVYAGYSRIPLTFQTSYWPINNSTGFELRTGAPFKVTVPTGQFGQDSFQVQVFYNNAQFASGWVSRVR